MHSLPLFCPFLSSCIRFPHHALLCYQASRCTALSPTSLRFFLGLLTFSYVLILSFIELRAFVTKGGHFSKVPTKVPVHSSTRSRSSKSPRVSGYLCDSYK